MITYYSEVPANSARGRGQWVCGTEESCKLSAMLDSKGSPVGILRPVLTASRPCHTIAHMGPLSISTYQSVVWPSHITLWGPGLVQVTRPL